MIFGIPRLPFVLGVLGLIPFVGWAIFSLGWLAAIPGSGVLSHRVFELYAVMIAGFMAALHWAWAMANDHYKSGYVASISLGLAAWVCALLMPGSTALLSTVFVLIFMVDRHAAKIGVAPSWYIRLRLPLTLVVGSCLLVVHLSA